MSTIETVASPVSEKLVIPVAKKDGRIVHLFGVLEDIIGGIIDALLPGGSKDDDGDAYQS